MSNCLRHNQAPSPNKSQRANPTVSGLTVLPGGTNMGVIHSAANRMTNHKTGTGTDTENILSIIVANNYPVIEIVRWSR